MKTIQISEELYSRLEAYLQTGVPCLCLGDRYDGSGGLWSVDYLEAEADEKEDSVDCIVECMCQMYMENLGAYSYFMNNDEDEYDEDEED